MRTLFVAAVLALSSLTAAPSFGQTSANASVERPSEAEALAFHARLRDAFRAIAQAEPARCVLVDAARDPDAVADAVRAAVAGRLPGLLDDTEGRTDAA